MNILLVRLRLIGDVVFTTPAIAAMRRRFPDARITYLVESAAAPVVATNPHLSDVIVVPHTRGWTRLKDDVRLARELRARRYDLAIDFHGGPRSGWLTWTSGATVRVGYDVPGRSWMYNRVVHRPRVLRQRHSVENQWDLVAAADSSMPQTADPNLNRTEMPTDERARRYVDRRLIELGVPPAAQVVVVHVSAGNPFRRWPELSFAELAAGLAGHGDRWVILTAGPSDHQAVGRVIDDARRRAGARSERIVDAEGMSLPELRALFDRASLFVGGDSGPLHIASTSDIAIVGLYGPTLPERSAPWRPAAIPTASVDAGRLPCRPCDQRVCAPGDFRCLTTVTSGRVLDAAEALLEPSR